MTQIRQLKEMFLLDKKEAKSIIESLIKSGTPIHLTLARELYIKANIKIPEYLKLYINDELMHKTASIQHGRGWYK
jgi:hypothetical protein